MGLCLSDVDSLMPYAFWFMYSLVVWWFGVYVGEKYGVK
jgi:putative Mn2+ efflux pump MntP